MKNILQPTRIRLSEIPEQGHHYLYTRQSAELNESLASILPQKDYQIDVMITPVGNAFEIRGSISTRLDLICSRCAIDIDYKLDHRFQELIMVEKNPLGRQDKSSKSNHANEWSEDGPYCNFIESDDFDMGEFLYEQLAVAEPIRPLGKESCDDSCENYQKALLKGWISQEGLSRDLSESPFAVLSSLKNEAKN